ASRGIESFGPNQPLAPGRGHLTGFTGDVAMAVHSVHSSYREKLLEHLFIGEVLRYLWRQGITTAEFLRPEVDSGGYDLVIACNTVIRYIQLKSSHRGASTSKQNVNIRLADKPSGCVVWVVFEEETLACGPFL